MGVNHGGADIRVAQQLLHRAYVGAGLQQVRGKAMAQRVYRHMFGDSGLRYRQFELPPQAFFKQVAAPLNARARIDR